MKTIPPIRTIRTLITSIFGVFIPPRKKRAGRDRHFTMRFVLIGTVPAKKNNQLAVPRYDEAENRMNLYLRGGSIEGVDIEPSPDGRLSITQCQDIMRQVRAIIVPSNRFQLWHNKKMEAINRQMATYLPLLQARGLIFPLSNVSMAIYHHWKDIRTRDLSNRLQSIEDLFTDCQLILDDNDNVLGPITTDAGRYNSEILDHITVIHLTAYY